MNSNSKSILAKLLAKENITINHGNYPTAFFDVDKRILGLPLWKEMDKHVYDLMIGHEIGHALETPCDGWHNSTFDIPGCPRAFVNVIEDIRIEKLIQRRYPGLVRSFKLGYSELMKSDFFGTSGKDVDTMSFMNRLNLKSKLRDLIDVTFSSEEQPYVDMAMSVETWDDVIKTCRAIYEYLKEKQENEKQKEQTASESNDRSGHRSSQESNGQGVQSASEEGEPDAQDFDDASDEDNSLDSDSSDEAQVQVHHLEDRQNDEQNEQKQTLEAGASEHGELQDVLDVSTDDAYRKNEESLVERDKYGVIPQVVNALNRNQLKEVIVSYPELAKGRQETRDLYKEVYSSNRIDYDQYNNEYKKFMDETSKIVGVMVKEFEMRKAAYQYSRSKTARSGTLNVSKLHEYKFSDDIFRKVTKLADAKSHGMIMLIDRSGSMRHTIADVIRQTLTLAMFCKKVNIPFDVYSYTSLPSMASQRKTKVDFFSGDIHHLSLVMCQVLSSSLKRAEYDEAFRTLFDQSVGTTLDQQFFWARCEAMGGTPSCEVMSAMPSIVSDFKSKHGVQKIIVPVLTDGEPTTISYHRFLADGSTSISLAHYNIVMNVNGTYFKANTESKLFVDLANHLRSMGVITVGYFLTDSSSNAKYMVGRAAKSWEKDTFKKASKEQRENKFVSFDDTLGYDRFFIVRTNSLSTQIDEFEIKEGARANEITRAFKKYATSKKTNRIFASQFAEIVS
jgi:hypothetical protein